MPATAPAAPRVEGGPPPPSLKATVIVVAAGLFVTGMGWPGLIGRLPFGLLLKNQLGLPPQRVAAFWAIATFAWYIKPAVGLLCDAYPLFGTRRRGYLILGAAAGALMWLGFGLVPRGYYPLLAVMVGLNLALVVVSTAVGGMLVEAGQRFGATGRLSALRQGLTGVMSLVAGPLGGWLATRAFGWTVGLGSLILLSFVPVAALLAREPGGARKDQDVLAAARVQVRNILRSRPMWAASGLVLLVYLAPGLQTPLLYHQQDVLRFDPPLMGLLELVGGAGALVGALIYAVVCRWVPLRTSLVAGILLNTGSTLFYLAYDSRAAAIVITGAAGVLQMLAFLPLFDLAARATPRGSESFGYALIMSLQNIAVYAVSDVLGSYLYGGLHLPFKQLVWVNAASTAAVLLAVPLLPRALLAAREGRPEATSDATSDPTSDSRSARPAR